MRTTDLSSDVLFLVMAAEQGGDTVRIQSWDQLRDLHPTDVGIIRKDGWREDFIMEATRVLHGEPTSVWICGRQGLAQCEADASSGVIWLGGI